MNVKDVSDANLPEKEYAQAEFVQNDTQISLVSGDKVLQTISLSEEALEGIKVAPYAKKFITDLDVNFDGKNDLGVFQNTGYAGVNNYYDFYIYDEIDQKLDKNKYLTAISNPTVDVLGRINNVVISTYRSGPLWYSDVYFHNDDLQGGDMYIKEVAKDSNPDIEFQYYAHQPTKTLPEMPLKDLFISLVHDDEVDISVLQSDYEWAVYVIEKDKNKYKGEKVLGPIYTDDVLYLSITTKSNWDKEVENAKKDVEHFNIGNTELRQEVLNGVVWNYYDFFDGYDGGYLRDYFIEKEGYVLNFAIANEVIENNSDISLIPKIQFLKKLNLE